MDPIKYWILIKLWILIKYRILTHLYFLLNSRTELESALGDPVRGARILGLHFVGQRISADDVRIHRPQNDFKVKLG